jgi:hypothetical protein
VQSHRALFFLSVAFQLVETLDHFGAFVGVKLKIAKKLFNRLSIGGIYVRDLGSTAQLSCEV